MSNLLISRSADLSALAAAEYGIEVRGGYLIVKHIPYVTQDREIQYASIVTNLDIIDAEGGKVTTQPSDHRVWWTGSTPHTADGESMEDYLVCDKWKQGRDIGEGIKVYTQWSRKPKEGGQARGYKDYREKIETYVEEVGGQAEAIRPGVLLAAKKGGEPIVTSSMRFAYTDTSGYRNGTKGIENRIEEEIVAVIGVGGTGSYLIDVLAKTNVKELHLFDDDVMKLHNAFRVSGAARVEELNGKKLKIDWHEERYKEVRKEGLLLHDTKIDAENLEDLDNFTTVFIAVDDLAVRRRIQRACTKKGILHVSIGIGLEIEGENNNQIGGMVKVETNFKPGDEMSEIEENSDGEQEPMGDVYSSNIQTAELNMLGAALAIAEWKAIRGIYRNERDEGNDTT